MCSAAKVGADSGTSKYSKAKANNTKLIDEDGLLSLVAACAGLVPQPAPQAAAPAPVRAPAAQAGPSRAGPSTAGRSAGASGMLRHVKAASGATFDSPHFSHPDLWVEKHKPKTPADLVGNGKFINDLRQWLQSWHRCVPPACDIAFSKLKCCTCQQKHGAESGRQGEGRGCAQEGGPDERPAWHWQDQLRQNHLRDPGLRRDGGERQRCARKGECPLPPEGPAISRI